MDVPLLDPEEVSVKEEPLDFEFNHNAGLTTFSFNHRRPGEKVLPSE